MILWFNDAIFNRKCKTKGKWERAEFKNSHELFRKTRKGVLGLFPFILFQWMKILSKYFAGFDLGVLRNADLNWFISAEEQKWRRPPSKEHLLKCAFKVFPGYGFPVQSISGKLLYLKARLPASSDDDNVFLNSARMRLQRSNEKTKAIE